MPHSVTAQLLVPFLATCALPGILSVPLLIKRTEVNLLSFFIYAALGGIFFQLITSFITGTTSFVPIAPYARILLISAGMTTVLGWLAWRKQLRLRVYIGAYETASLALLILTLFVLRGNLNRITPPYFNPASDQYYWLAYAEASLYDPAFVAIKVFTSEIHRPVFFLLIAPYVAFLPKTVDAYQYLMVAWTYGIYALIGIAIAELGRRNLNRKILGLMAMPMLFSFHWLNYYLISGDVAPQGIAIFLFITGFILWQEATELRLLWLFLAIFYAIHLGTLAVFGLAIGMAILLREGWLLCMRRFGHADKTQEPWHLFEKIFFLPTALVIILYALYAAGTLHYFKPALIMYYPQYEEHLTLFTQPYFGREQAILIWMGIAGAIIALIKRRRWEITMGFLLPWALLITPLLAYHAFYASWQSFRYYLFLYPSAVILTLLLIEWVADAVAGITSRSVSKGFIFIVTLGFLPVFALAASNQQKMVILDMLEGRDEGVAKNERHADMENLLAIAHTLPRDLSRPVAIYPSSALSTDVQWAFSPRETIALDSQCGEMACPAAQTLIPQEIDFFKADPDILLISRKSDNKILIDPKILKSFSLVGETKAFSIYLRR